MKLKLIELLNKRANGEIKEGTKINIDGLFYTIDNIPMHKEEFKNIFCFDVDELNTEVEIIEEKPQVRWKPKAEFYWYINNYGEVHRYTWVDDDADNFLYLFKNVFKTKEEAKEYLEYKKALLEAEKPFELGNNNWKIIFNKTWKDLSIQENFETMVQGAIYLGQDKDVAQAFVDKWYKQILKYEFGIEE